MNKKDYLKPELSVFANLQDVVLASNVNDVFVSGTDWETLDGGDL